MDDRSTDETVKEIHKYVYEQVRLIELMQNYGQSNAMAEGIEAATGKVYHVIEKVKSKAHAEQILELVA